MEYTDTEKQFLDLLKRTNFKNLSKNDVITYASRLNELRPEVAMQVMAQYPELVKLMKSILIEYRGMLEKVIESDDASINRVYDISEKELANNVESRILFNDLAKMALSNCSKCLDNPNLTPEDQNKIREQQNEILQLAYLNDKEIRSQEMEVVRAVDKKDSEKRMFNWKAIIAISTVTIVLVGVGGAALGGNFNLKLPKK